MTDKQLKSLSKFDLLNILHQQEKEIQMLIAEKLALSEQRLNFEQIGSLAEASVAASGIMQAAQDAADFYLKNLYGIEAEGDEVPYEREIEVKVTQTETICPEHKNAEYLEQLRQSFLDMLVLFDWHINKLITARSNFEKVVKSYEENGLCL